MLDPRTAQHQTDRCAGNARNARGFRHVTVRLAQQVDPVRPFCLPSMFAQGQHHGFAMPYVGAVTVHSA
jgi:hypothetical protein